MILRDNNKDALKGTMLRGFNNTPENIRNQIEKSKMLMGKPKQETPKTYNPESQREIIAKMNRINK